MPWRKYREINQWGKIDTQVFKRHALKANAERLPKFEIPEAVKAYGAVIHNPNNPSFFKQFESNLFQPQISHPALRQPSIQEHPLYNPTKCRLFESLEPFSGWIGN